MKDEFLATLSHELRTPLHAIQGWTGLLRERRARPEDYERGLETRERNVRLQVQIVNDLFDMSRIISGKIHLEVQPVYLHEIVNNAMEAVRQSADAKSIRIQPILDSRIGLVRADTCASLLELCGHHVETAYNAEHAIGLGGRFPAACDAARYRSARSLLCSREQTRRLRISGGFCSGQCWGISRRRDICRVVEVRAREGELIGRRRQAHRALPGLPRRRCRSAATCPGHARSAWCTSDEKCSFVAKVCS